MAKERANALASRLGKDESAREALIAHTVELAKERFEKHGNGGISDWLLRAVYTRHCTSTDGTDGSEASAIQAVANMAGDKDQTELQIYLELIGELPDPLLCALYLREVEGLTVAEVASITRADESTARDTIRRARHLLREIAEQAGLQADEIPHLGRLPD